MNLLLEVWNDFSVKIGLIYRTYIDNLWTKVIIVSVTLMLIILDIIPQWIQLLGLLITSAMVWSFFTSKKPASEPAQRQFSVTTTNSDYPIDSPRSDRTVNNDRFGQKSSTGRVEVLLNGHARTNHRKEDANLDESSSSSVVDRFGNPSSSKREPLDPITWSSVTSPGFTTRMVQKKGGNPLRECNGSNLSFSPLVENGNSTGKSPLRLGGGATSPYRPPSKLSAPNFQSPVNPTRYSVTGRRKAPVGTTYVPVASVDVINQTFNKSNNGPGSPGVDRQGGIYGLGGYPSSPTANLTTRMQKLWSPPMMGDGPVSFDASRQNVVMPSPSHSAHGMGQCPPGDPSMNRKRNRLPDNMMDKRSSPMRSGPSYQDELAKQNSKRTKYIQSANDLRYNVNASNRNLPYMALPNLQVNDESMTSESILEQMNQTEKRFLPDDDTIAAMRSPKKNRSSHGGKVNTSASSPSPYRKRRVPTMHAITSIDEDEDSEKNRGFCSCSECYEEAAGLDRTREKLANQSASLNDSVSANKKKKTISFNCDSSSSGKESSFITANTMETKSVDVTQKYTPVSLQIITKAKYEADRQRRVERLNRMLNESFKRSEYKGATCTEKVPENVGTGNTISFGISNGTTESKQTFGGSSTSVLQSLTGVPAAVGDEVDSSKTTMTSPARETNIQAEMPTVVATSSAFSFGTGNTNITAPTSSAVGIPGDNSTTSPFKFGVGSTSTDKPTVSVSSLPSAGPALSENKIGGFGFGNSDSSAVVQSGTTSSVFPLGTEKVTFVSSGMPAFGSSPSTITTASPAFGSTSTTSTGFSIASLPSTTSVAPATTMSSLFGTSGTPSSAPSSTTLTSSITAGGTSTPAVFSFGNQPATSFGSAVSDTTKLTALPAAVAAGTESSKPSVTTTTGGFSFGNTASQSAAPGTSAPSNFGSSFAFGSQPSAPSIGTQPPAAAISTTATFGQANPSGSALPSLFGKTGGTSSLFGGGASTPGSSLNTNNTGSIEVKNISSVPSTTTGTTSANTAIFSFGQGNNNNAVTSATTSASQSSAGGFSFASGFGPKSVGSEATPANSSGFGQLNPISQKPAGTTFPQATPLFGSNNNPTPSSGLFGQGVASVATTNAASTTSAFSFGQTAPSTTTGGFGQGTATSPAFGQSNTSFGQSSTIAPVSPFGQSQGTSVPQFGQSNSSSTVPAFGQGNQSGGVPAFGQTSNSSSTPAFGSSSSGTSSFGQPNATSGSTPAFGQSSGGSMFGQGQGNSGGAGSVFGSGSSGSGGAIFGQTSNATPSFGQGSSTNPASPFGQSNASTSNTFGQTASSSTPAFGTPSNAASPFGQPSTGGFGQQTGNNSFGFGNTSSSQVSQSANTFGGQSTPQNAFGGQSNQQNAFGSSVNQPATNFGTPAPKPLFGQTGSTTNNNNNSFSFGQTQQQPSAGFNFGAAAAASNTGNNNNTAASPFGGGFNSPPANNGMFGSSNNNQSQAASPSGGAYQFGQAVQVPNQAGFNFSAQAPPAFGQQQQQQAQMFSVGAPSSTARRQARHSRRVR